MLISLTLSTIHIYKIIPSNCMPFLMKGKKKLKIKWCIKMYCMIVKISRVKRHFPLRKWHSQTWISFQFMGFRKFNFKIYELWGKYNYITKRLRSSKNITLFRYMGHRFEVKLHIHQTPRLSFYVILNQVTWISSKKNFVLDSTFLLNHL